MQETRIENLLFSIIKNQIFGSKNVVIPELSEEDQRKLYVLAKKHDLAHVLARAMSGAKLDEKVKNAFSQQEVMAVFRYERQIYEFNNICEKLNSEKIDFIPLKGAIIRKFYPEPWMRTSCDIDILIKEKDLDRAVKALTESLDCKQEGPRNFHDVSLMFASNVHLELHFNILENMDNIDSVLKDVWDYAKAKNEDTFEYEMSNEFLIYHIVAHMLYHFVNGGCGVRPFIDLFVLKKNLSVDENKLNELLKKANAQKFYKEINNLCEVWFGEKEHTDTTKVMEEYVLTGGVYGNVSNTMAVNKAHGESKRKYLWRRIFLSYKNLKARYPVLKKHRWLVPFFQVWRWIEVVFAGKAGKLKREMQAFNSVSQDAASGVEKLLKDLEI